MGRYLIRRIGFTVLVLFVVSLLTFLIFVKLPSGDPARRATGKSSTPEQIENAREAFGLDQPLWVQYGRFAKGLIPLPGLFLSEDVYYSYGNFIPVREEIARRLPVTVALAVGGAALWLLIGIPVGIAAGVRRKSSLSRASMLLAIAGVSIPVFWLGQLLLYVFWFRLGWAPPSGMDIGVGVWGSVLGGRFLLPWITVAVGYAAFYARMVRSNVIETMHEDYIRTARAKGLSEYRISYKHVFRNAFVLILTTGGLLFGSLIGQTVVVERVFSWPGIGSLLVESIFQRDIPIAQGCLLVIVMVFLIVNLLVDILYNVINSQIDFK